MTHGGFINWRITDLLLSSGTTVQNKMGNSANELYGQRSHSLDFPQAQQMRLSPSPKQNGQLCKRALRTTESLPRFPTGPTNASFSATKTSKTSNLTHFSCLLIHLRYIRVV